MADRLGNSILTISSEMHSVFLHGFLLLLFWFLRHVLVCANEKKKKAKKKKSGNTDYRLYLVRDKSGKFWESIRNIKHMYQCHLWVTRYHIIIYSIRDYIYCLCCV